MIFDYRRKVARERAVENHVGDAPKSVSSEGRSPKAIAKRRTSARAAAKTSKRAAAASAKDFATVCPDSETLIKTFTTLSANEAMGSGNAKTTYEWIKSAEALHKMICANKRIEFAEHSVEIKEAYLDLAERRFELLRRKNEATMPKRANPPRRTERLKEELDRMFGHPPYAAAQSA